MSIDHRGRNIAMAKQFLNGSDILTGFQQVSFNIMAKNVGRYVLRRWRFANSLSQRLLNSPIVNKVAPKQHTKQFGIQEDQSGERLFRI